MSPAARAAPVAREENPWGEESWGALVPLDSPDLPTFNLEHLPAWAGEFASALAASTETPPELAGGLVLAACSVAAARRLRVEIKPGWAEPTNLWVCVALPSGNRKSAVLTAATAPLLEWERGKAAAMCDEIFRLKSARETKEACVKDRRARAARAKDSNEAEALAHEAAELELALSEVPLEPRLWTSDATPERLGSLLAEHSECLAWLSSEGGIFEIIAGRYSKGVVNLDLMLKAHAGDPERVDRGSRPPVFLDSPRLTIGLSPQPSVLAGLASRPEFRGRGLLARFLYLVPSSNLGFRALQTVPVPEATRAAYFAGLRAMLDWPTTTDEHGATGPYVLRLTEAAAAELHTFAGGVETSMRPGGQFEAAQDWAAKAPGAAARIAAVLHGITYAHDRPWRHPIEKQTTVDTLEIMGVFGAHSRQALADMGADSGITDARRVWAWVARQREQAFSLREAYRGLHSRFPRVAQLRAAVAVLEERGYVRVNEPMRDSPGRPASPLIVVRPELCEGWR